MLDSADSTVPSIELARLFEKDGTEIAKLVEALEYPGFFYLDFSNAPGMDTIDENARLMYDLSDNYFQKPTEFKSKDARVDLPSWSDRGYKFCETDESYEIPHDELRDGNLALPQSMEKQLGLMKTFYGQCDKAARVVLAQLAAALDIERLEHLHDDTEPSETGLKLIYEPSVPFASDVIENKHRDSGTLTMLFYESWSMHIYVSKKDGGHDDHEDDDDGQKDWVFVPPPPAGFALVHGAKSLARLSGGRLRAPLHRVTQPGDGAGKRYFLSYFLRPAHRLREEWAAADAVATSA